MIIRSVEMHRFMVHQNTKIDLPETGVALITGENGSGKSTIIEAVAHAVFGKSVRGDWGWQDADDKPRGFSSEVLVRTDRVDLHRAKGRGSPSLEWVEVHNAAGGLIPSAEPKSYGSTSKAQHALEQIVGTFPMWVRAHVFSSSDAAHFTLATDSERKRLLEQMLGIYYFDSAGKLAKAQYTKAEATIADLRGSISLVESQRAIANAELTAAEDVLTRTAPTFDAPADVSDLVLPDEPDYPAEPVVPELDAPDPECDKMRESLDRVDRHLASVEEDIAEADEARDGHTKAIMLATSKVNDARKELDQWPGGKCPKCAQPIPEDQLAPLVEKSEALAAEGEHERSQAGARCGLVQKQLDEIKVEKGVLTERRRELAKQLATHDGARDSQIKQGDNARRQHINVVNRIKSTWERECDALTREHATKVQAREDTLRSQQRQLAEYSANALRYEEQRDAANLRLHDLGVEEENLQDQRSDADWALHRAASVVNVFGIKGMRAHVIGQALTGLQELTNGWLKQIGKPGQEVRLREYSEQARGGNTPALSLEMRVNHARDNEADTYRWQRYKAASGGERRRVDVAIILALAEVARAARGKSRGTLFFDEVLDALDADGIDKVMDVIHELAQDRCVVLISHNADLIKSLRPAVHVHMEDGNVR